MANGLKEFIHMQAPFGLKNPLIIMNSKLAVPTCFISKCPQNSLNFLVSPLRAFFGCSKPMSEVTQLLEAIGQGNEKAADTLLPIVYEELRRLAAHQMASQNPGHTLQATALVHEAYIRLAGGKESSWNDRGHFFRAASEAMRQILIDTARSKSRKKRGGGKWVRVEVELHQLNLATEANDDTLLIVHEALDRLSHISPPKAELVKLRFFVGLSNDECAQILQISLATVKRYWEFSRAWLLNEIEEMQNET